MISTKNKKKISLRKTLIIIGWSLLCIWAIFAFMKITPTDMFNSVLSLSKIQQNRKIQFSQKKELPKVILQDSCIDSDWGKNYETKWTITTVISGYTRVEEDSCNSNWTLKEWFCGNPWEAAWLLRSENYVNCAHGCNNGACNPYTWAIKDLAVQWGNFIASNPQEAIVTLEVKNIGNVALSTDGIWHSLFLESNWIVLDGNEYLFDLTTPSNVTLQANQTYIFSATIKLLNNLNFTNNSTINVDISIYPEIDMYPDNNSSTLYITGNLQTIPSWVGDIIIDDIQLLPTHTPLLHSDFSTNTFQVTVKNIWTWSILLPKNSTNNWAIQIPFICYYPGGGNGQVFSSVLSENILWANQSLVTQFETVAMPVIDMFWSPWEKSIICEIVTQQQQLSVNPELVLNKSNPYMIYETDGSNNAFTSTYKVIWQMTAPGDIIIKDMYITPNTSPTLGTNNNINKINLVIKNIWSGTITIPEIHGERKFSLSCSYPAGWAWFISTPVSWTLLQANDSVTLQLGEQGSDTFDWFSSVGNKFITCTILSQQQQWRQNPDPINSNFLFETNWTNNSFTLNYSVVANKKTETALPNK